MQFIRKHYILILLSIPVISIILHWHVFNLDLVGIHVWRQTETQTTINNFYTEDFNILNPRYNSHADTSRLHRMEFPLMQWIFALFYKLLGPHIIITRLLTFIIGLFSVYGIFRFADNIFKNKGIAIICAWCFNWSPVFYYYTLNPMPDNLALCFSIWSLVFFYNYINTRKIKNVIWSAIFLCLATLVKLPFILYGSLILAFILLLVLKKDIERREAFRVIIAYAIFIIPPAAWYITVIPTWENITVKGLFDPNTNHSAIIDVITGTLVSVLPELLINYGSVLFFLFGFYLLFKRRLYHHTLFPIFLAWGLTIILYFLYEMAAIDLVHDYYLFPFLPAIFLLVGYGAYQLLATKGFIKYIAMTCLLILPFTAYIRADSRWDIKDPGFNAAYLKYKNELRSITPPGAYCIVGNDPSGYILLYYIDRKGWTFNDNHLDEKTLNYYITKGAGYLFIDSRFDTVAGIKVHLNEKIFDKETLRVYKLK